MLRRSCRPSKCCGNQRAETGGGGLGSGVGRIHRRYQRKVCTVSCCFRSGSDLLRLIANAREWALGQRPIGPPLSLWPNLIAPYPRALSSPAPHSRAPPSYTSRAPPAIAFPPGSPCSSRDRRQLVAQTHLVVRSFAAPVAHGESPTSRPSEFPASGPAEGSGSSALGPVFTGVPGVACAC